MSKNKEESQKTEKMQKKQKNAIMALVALVAILAGANLWTFFYYVPGKINSSNGIVKTQYKFLDPSRGIYNKKDLIVNIQPLREELENIGKDKNISIYFEYLPTGANIAVNKDAEFWPASLLKLPTAMAVAKKIESGKWKWTNELVLMAADKDSRFGDLYKDPTGTKFTIEDLVKKTLTESDNTANLILLRNLEAEEVEDIYNHLGLMDFFAENGKISAKKYSVMFRALYNASYLSEEYSQKLLLYMSESSFKEYLESGLPPSVIFSHKVGISDNKNVLLDSGIVYSPRRTYLLTVMINASDMIFGKKQMKEISEKVYNYIVNYAE